jgi:hypothetical protein
MKRYVIAAAVAVALGLGSATTARAQYVIPYGGVTPNGGVVSGNSIYNLGGGVSTYNTYISPFGTVKQSVYNTNAFGTTYGTTQAYNPYTGYGYTRGYYNPGYGGGFPIYPTTFYPAQRIAPAYSLGGFGYGLRRY